MADVNRYTWVPAFEALARALLPFRHDRATLIAKLAESCDLAGQPLPRLDSVTPPADIDPFTIMALFAKDNAEEARLRLLKAFFKVLGLSLPAPAPEDFAGLTPSVGQNLTLYPFSDNPGRHPDDLDRLWALFALALDLAREDTPRTRAAFAAAYDAAEEVMYTRWKLLIALFYVAPNTFVSLDYCSRWYLSSRAHVSAELASRMPECKAPSVPTGEEFLAINDAVWRELETGALGGAKRPYELVEVATQAYRARTRVWLYQPRDNTTSERALKAGLLTLPMEGVGDWATLGSKEAVKAALQDYHKSQETFQTESLAMERFAAQMRVGDLVYLRQPQSQELLAVGVVNSPYRFVPEADVAQQHQRRVTWREVKTVTMPQSLNQRLLTELTEATGLVDSLAALYPDRRYGKADFLREAYLSEADATRLFALLEKKKAVILQGAPGVGKSFLAKRLAYWLMGERPEKAEKTGQGERLHLVQFHQSYSYEDFIMGFHPTETGFALKTGAFYRFCQRAAADPARRYVFLIDEINRGNLSKIFGELFLLLEADKRGEAVSLLYNDESFTIPPNLYLIGMMNTADRSLALLDFALRRRFAFFTLNPAFATSGFRRYQASLESPAFDRLISVVERLNAAIRDDLSLGAGYQIGHSFFAGLTRESVQQPFTLESLIDYELAPLLSEYWFDEPERASDWVAELKRALG